MRFILGVLIGIAAGAVLGLIMAPQSGKETRESLRKRMQQRRTTCKRRDSAVNGN